MSELEVPVLVVGGSLVGLTASALLGAHGVPNLLVERHRGTAIHPRAASFHQRTMEVFRELGLQDAVEAAAAREFVQNGAIIAVESLSGKELVHFYTSFNDGVEGLSPTARLFITQIGLEPVLRAKAEELGADVRYGTELVSFEQDDEGVHSVIRSRDGGPDQAVHSRYLIAADGAHSAVRERLGIARHGRGDFANCITIYFRADVSAMIGERNLSVVYVNRPDLLGFFRFAIDAQSGFLAVFSTTDAHGTRTTDISADMSPERCIDYVRTALGCAPDTPIEIDNVQPWTASAGWAERFAHGRVLLAGDAAHVMPPTGGFGGNTGVADAHNLAWKLALVLDGTAGAGLLDTYDAERRPASALIVEQAYTRYVTRVDTTLPKDDLAPPLDDPSIELGTRYRSAGVHPPLPSDDAPLHDPRAPVTGAGVRAPHVPVERDGTAISTLDLFGPGFVLIAGSRGEPWCAAAAQVAADLSVPLTAYRVGADGTLVDREWEFETAYGVGPSGAAIVRPDGVIAWHVSEPADDPVGTLRSVVAHLLSRADSEHDARPTVIEPAV
jgi:2-polyprenyl-6-methoxyphenol hydroxylase-like FAD-dependent oxidoreductase